MIAIFRILYANSIAATCFLHSKSTGTRLPTFYRRISVSELLPLIDHGRQYDTTTKGNRPIVNYIIL